MTRRLSKPKPPVRKSKRSSVKAASPDAVLIHECISYARTVAAFRAGFEADPDGNFKYASRDLQRYSARASAVLHKIACISSKSAAGLEAKARILPMIIKDDAGGMEEASEAFYLAFATDVRQFLGPILDQESTPQLNGKK